MDRAEAICAFWAGFGLPAYDEQFVPPKARMPYITYETATGGAGAAVRLTASLWYKGFSWEEAEQKREEIARAVSGRGYAILPVEGGYVWIRADAPFSRRMGDPRDPMIKRIAVNVRAEFLTAF